MAIWLADLDARTNTSVLVWKDGGKGDLASAPPLYMSEAEVNQLKGWKQPHCTLILHFDLFFPLSPVRQCCPSTSLQIQLYLLFPGMPTHNEHVSWWPHNLDHGNVSRKQKHVSVDYALSFIFTPQIHPELRPRLQNISSASVTALETK